MKTLYKLAILTLFVSIISPAYIYFQGVQVDPILVFQVQVACDRLQKALQGTYGKSANTNAVNYYIRTYAANYFLQQLSAQPSIAQYNNILLGDNGSVTGNRNLIIGNNANVIGDSNYVFSNTYTNNNSTPIDNSLILDQWLIKLILLNDKGYFSNPKSYIYPH